MTYREDPVETRVSQILSLEQSVQEARKKLGQGEGDRRGVMIQEVLLAKARYEQARDNERLGRGRAGAADALLEQWQASQDALDDLRMNAMADVRNRINSYYADGIDADTAAQMRRHA